MISILLPCYNAKDLLPNVFRESRSSVSVEVICYDNGGNGKEVRKDKSFTWIGNGKNIGLNAALNECAKAAKYNYFYLPHADMCLMPGWDTSLLKIAKFLAPQSFLLCSRSVEPQQGHTPFHIIKDYGQEAQDFRCDKLFQDFANYKDTSIVTGYRMPYFCHRQLWEKMGGVDESYFSYATDNDLFVSAYHAGVRRFWMVNQSLVYHLQGKSNATQNVDKNSDKPYQYFRNKWKRLGYNTEQHIDEFEKSLCPWNVKVR